jgi:hypothetical protein
VSSRLLLTLLIGLSGANCAAPPGDDSPANAPRESTAAVPKRLPVAAGKSDCPADRVYRHPDPVSLVAEFARRDADGRLERDEVARAWHDHALTCVARSTSDHYEVITAFYVEPLSVKPLPRRRTDTTAVLVRRTRAYEVGWDSAGRAPRLVPALGDWIDTVVVVRTRYGWRIDRLKAGAHRFPSRALVELTKLKEADRELLHRLGKPNT